IHAAELVVEPNFQILRRHRRSLLLRLERAHRSAVENHVHRPPRLGSRRSLNLRIGIRYVRSASTADIAALIDQLMSASAQDRRSVGGGADALVYSPAFHLASGQISGTSLPLCVQGSTVHSSLVLRSLITAVLCGPSVNRNRDTRAAIAS